MGKKVEKVEQAKEEGFDLLEEDTQQKKVGTAKEDKEEDIYNLLGNLRLQYVTKKSKNGKVNLQLQLQSKEQLMTLLSNVQKVQNALTNGEYVVAPIAQRTPYSLVLVITKNSAILKITYLSGFIKNVNMSIPISISTINSLQAIVNTLQNSELGKKLLSISTLSNNTEQTQNLL
jgi:spermidine/putrescine-binding protein